MKQLVGLVSRNTKLFFKDKGMFFSAMITPLILICLYVTFLAKIYSDSVANFLNDISVTSKSIKNGFVAGWIFSNLLAVCSVTISFCCSLIMIQDKFQGQIKDITISPVKKSTIALSYFISTAIVSMIICYIALFVGFIYIAIVGWYLSVIDVVLVILDVFILTLFGSAFACIINNFLKTQGQMSAVGTAVSCVYGFICGAYMPLSSFPKLICNGLMFLPSTYGTNAIHNHFLNGIFEELKGAPVEAIEGIRKGFDLDLYFFGSKVNDAIPILIIIISTAILIGIYVFISVFKNSKEK
ncbi:MAG: ABC transporter permease [Anaeroplasmataceae bacterium]